MSVDANEFLFSTGVRSASLKEKGASVTGHIIRQPEVQQQRDFDTGELMFWKDGNPRNQLRIVLMTDEQDPGDPEDSGERALYARGNMLNAIRNAVRQAGAPGLEVGGKLRVKYIGDGKATQPRLSPPKLYEAQYRAPEARPVEVPKAQETEPAQAATVSTSKNDEVPF